jgi:hypothetical protein
VFLYYEKIVNVTERDIAASLRSSVRNNSIFTSVLAFSLREDSCIRHTRIGTGYHQGKSISPGRIPFSTSVLEECSMASNYGHANCTLTPTQVGAKSLNKD